jgi:hypothetical protein
MTVKYHCFFWTFGVNRSKIDIAGKVRWEVDKVSIIAGLLLAGNVKHWAF